ncbi:hypothetical protein ACFQY4_32760 [Catellatospora bangladeshensis]|uniref:hypothetical protein n=1 Tax=Catellatospora bangladeshensis TaxID=310355 RepID=UPI00360D6745
MARASRGLDAAPGWRPDPSWPQPPDDWQFWVPDGADDPTLLFELTDEDGFAAGPLDSVDEFVREQAEQGEQLPVAGVPLGEPAPAIAPVWAAEAAGADADAGAAMEPDTAGAPPVPAAHATAAPVMEPVAAEPTAAEPVAAVLATPATADAPSPPVTEPVAATPLTADPASPPVTAPEPVAEPVAVPAMTLDPLPEPQTAPAMPAEPIAEPAPAFAMSSAPPVTADGSQLLGCTHIPEVVDAKQVSAAATLPEAAWQGTAQPETGQPETVPAWRDERAALGWPADAGSSAEPAWAATGPAEPAWTPSGAGEQAQVAGLAWPQPAADTPAEEPPSPPSSAEPQPEPVADLPPVAAPAYEPVPEPAMTSSAGFAMGTDGPAAAPVSAPAAHVPAHAAPHVPAHARPATPRPWWIWALGGAAGLLLCSVLGVGGFLALRPDGSPSAVAEPGATAVQAPGEAAPSQEAQARPIPSPSRQAAQAQPQDQVFEGTGPQTVPVELGDTFHTVALTYAGAGDFVVRTVKADGEEIQTLVATTDSYEGYARWTWATSGPPR